MLKFWHYKTAENYGLHPRDPASKDSFCSWFSRSVAEVRSIHNWESFLTQRGLTCKGYIGAQNSGYPLTIHDVPLNTAEVGMWCALAARTIPGSVFL